MTIDYFTYWIVGCGLAAQVWICWRGGVICGRLIYAAIAACSFVRFAWACGLEHGFRPMRCPIWAYAPVVWFDMFVLLAGSGGGKVSHMGGAGSWKGISNWTVFPKEQR